MFCNLTDGKVDEVNFDLRSPEVIKSKIRLWSLICIAAKELYS